MLDSPDGAGGLLVRPGWAGFSGPLEGTLRTSWFRGPHSDHLVETPMGELLIREPGPPRHQIGGLVRWRLLHSWPLPASG